MASLCEAYVGFIYIYKSAGRNAFKNIIYLAPEFIDFKIALVNTAGVIVGNEWRVVRIGIVDVGVVGVFITEYLPTGRNGYGVPFFDFFGYVDIA